MIDSARQMADDLRFVRGVVDRPGVSAPASLFVLWALIGAVGFALVDLAPRAVPWYWLACGPLGGAVSAWLGINHGRRTGATHRPTGLRWVFHWAGFLAAVGGVVVLALTGVLPESAINPTVVVLLAIAYFMAGVHLERRLLTIAAAFVIAMPLPMLLPQYGWIVAGSVVGVATLVTAFVPVGAVRV